MADVLGRIFIDPTTLPDDSFGFCQVTFLCLVYGYILFYASNLISDGSELLLLIPAWAGIVGSVVLPVLGAIPDGMMVLFSGMGQPDPVAQQQQLAVGIGALAGSTIMLLTIPWSLAILAGRVNIGADGKPTYRKPKTRNHAEGAPPPNAEWLKLDPPGNLSLFSTGVGCTQEISDNAKYMMYTCAIYAVIQGPVFAAVAKSTVRVWALVAMILCIVLFLVYLRHCNSIAADEKTGELRSTQQMIVDGVRKDNIANGSISLSGAMFGVINKWEMSKELVSLTSARQHNGVSMSLDAGSALLSAQQTHESQQRELRRMLRPFFLKYDLDGNNSLDREELRCLLADLNEHMTSAEFDVWMKEMDTDSSGTIEFGEFCEAMVHFVLKRGKGRNRGGGGRQVYRRPTGSVQFLPPIAGGSMDEGACGGYMAKLQLEGAKQTLQNPVKTGYGYGSLQEAVPEEDQGEVKGGEDDESDDDEEEMPEEFAHLSPKEQMTKIRRRAFSMMLAGTLLVLLFSDPMVDVMNDMGTRSGIKPFYIAFVLAPMASNASEMIASYNYAAKKTRKTITISFSALLGAACMNNTFCLGIFMALVYFKDLHWEFTAETLAIIAVEVCMAVIALKRTHRLFDGLLVLMLYPLSLMLVAGLEAYGFD